MLTPAVAAQFLVVRCGAGYTAYRSPKGLSPLLGYLRGLGVTPLPVAAVPQGPSEVLLERYRGYLVGERGLGVPTARGYVDLVRPFVVGRVRADGVDVAGLSPADVVGFVLDVSGERTPKMTQRMVSALRSLLRFCHVEGLLGLRWPRQSRQWPTGGRGCRVSWNPPRWSRCWRRVIAAVWPGVVTSR